MKPRIRTFVLVLALALLAAPAQALASWAQPFAATSSCGGGTAPFAVAGTDAITVNPAWTTGPVNIALAGTGTNFEWKLDCGSANAGVNGGTAIVNTNGTHTFTHRAQNGIWSDWVDDTVQIDNSTPTNSTVVPGGWHAGPYSVTLGVGDSVSPVHGEYKIDGASSWTTGGNAVITGTGTHTLDTRAVDSAGNAAPVNFTNIQVDQTAPNDTTTFTSAWQHNSAVVTLTANDADSGISAIMWQLDGGVVTAANPNDPLTISTQGVHTLITYAVDAVGNQSGPRTTIVRVDRNGPTDNTTVPAGWVNTPTVNVSITGDDGTGSGVVRTEWELEDLTTHVVTTGDVAGPGPVPVSVTGEGQHELRTRLTDALGDTSGWKNQLVRIDTVAPSDATTPSAGWQKLTTLNVNVNGTDATSGVQQVEWKLDGVAGNDPSASHPVPVAGNGEFVLESRVQDNAGNWSEWISHTVRLDTTAPTDHTPAVDADWRTSSYAVKLSGTDSPSGVARVEWRVDAGATHQGTNNLETATVSGNGTHTLETRIVDNAGNDSGWLPQAVNIDSLRPTATTTCPSSAVATGTQVALTGTDAGPSGVSNHGEWQLDGGAEHSGMTATILGGGPHTLKTRVQDNAGNWSDWLPCAVTVDPALTPVDSTPPVDYTSVPTGWRLVAVPVTVLADDGTGTGVDTVEWQVDDGDVQQANGNTAAFTISTEGVHDIRTRATDSAGNSSIWKEQTVKIDLTRPTDTTVYPGDFTKLTSIPLTATDATSGVDHIEYRLSSGAAPTTGTSVPLGADGSYTLETRVFDKAGQRTGWVSHPFVKDTVVPANTSAPVPSAWQTSAFSLALTGTDVGSGVDHYEWKIGAGGTVHTDSTAVVSADGTQTLMTQVVDKAGNVSGFRSDTVKVDTTKPANTTPGVTSGWRKTNFTTTVAGTDATSGVQKVEWRVDGGSITATPSVTISTTGSHLFETRITDNAGNVTDWQQATIGIDKVVPTLNVTCGAVAWRAAPATCTVTASGGESGLPTLAATRGGVATDVTGGAYTVDADGRWTINFRAIDGAGNETTANADVQIDRTAPTVSVSCTAGAGTSYSCSASGSDSGSGVSTLSYSIDGGAATQISGGAFTAQKGNVVVFATDAAGNAGASKPVALADRTPAPKKPTTGSGSGSGSTTKVTPRTTSSAVMAVKGGSASSRLLGQLAIASTPSKTSVDLRPLALGKGKFQFVFKVTVGKKTKTYTKTQTTKKGYSTRIAVSGAAGASAKVSLTVKKRSGSRWVSYATASAHLG